MTVLGDGDKSRIVVPAGRRAVFRGRSHVRVTNHETRGQGTGVAKLLKIRSDAVLREDVNSRDIISADGWRVACSGFRFRNGSPASTSFYARATRADALKKAAAWRLSAIGTALGGSHDGYGRGNIRGGRDPKLMGRLSVYRPADAAEGAFSQLRVHRNSLDVPFMTYQRGTDG